MGKMRTMSRSGIDPEHERCMGGLMTAMTTEEEIPTAKAMTEQEQE
jgi:hypothetical protein